MTDGLTPFEERRVEQEFEKTKVEVSFWTNADLEEEIPDEDLIKLGKFVIEAAQAARLNEGAIY